MNDRFGQAVSLVEAAEMGAKLHGIAVPMRCAPRISSVSKAMPSRIPCGITRRCRLRHCSTTSGVTPDEFVSAADITGELGLRVYLGPPIGSVNQVTGTGSTARTIGSQQILC